MAQIRHITVRVAKRARISLSSFRSNVLLLEGMFIEFIMTYKMQLKSERNSSNFSSGLNGNWETKYQKIREQCNFS